MCRTAAPLITLTPRNEKNAVPCCVRSASAWLNSQGTGKGKQHAHTSLKLPDKLHSGVWLRYCHLNLLWDLCGGSGQRVARADRGQPGTPSCVCWSIREVMLSAAPLRTRRINHLLVIRRCLRNFLGFTS